MKIAYFVAWLGLIAMSLILFYGFTQGDFFVEGSRLLAMPWGIVSMVDLYVGFILFSAWIIYRENSFLVSMVWVLLMMILGFFTACLYVLLTLRSSQGDWKLFWMGKHASE